VAGEEAPDGRDVAVETIDLGYGRRARLVHAAVDTPAEEVARALRIGSQRGVVVLNGSTDAGPDGDDVQLRQLLVEGVAAPVNDERLCAVTGGTDVGVFASFGAGLDRSAVCVGVAPSACVTWPGRSTSAPDAVPLEPHHSHFVLVDGSEWGDETPMMMELARTLAAGGPSIAVLAGGGRVAHRELLGHVGAGRDVIVLGGSGRLADAVAAAIATGGGCDEEVLEAAEAGRVTVFGAGRGAAELRELLASRVRR
jgi:SLOG in TRPM, prokaryote